MAEKKREFAVYALMALHLVVILILVSSLPENVFHSNAAAKAFVGAVGKIAPSLEHVGQLSRFPQVAQLVYSYELMMIPLFCGVLFWGIKWDGPPSDALRSPVVSDLVILLLCAVIVWYLVSFPGSADGVGRSGRLGKLMMKSKFEFAVFSTVFSLGVSVCMFGIGKYAKWTLVARLFQYMNDRKT